MSDNWVWCHKELPEKGAKVIILTSGGNVVFDMTFKGKYYNEKEDTGMWISDCTLWRGAVVAWQPMITRPNNFYEIMESL